MIKEMYWLASDVVALGARIPEATDLPPPTVLHQRIAALFQEMAERARDLRLEQEDVTEARYALAAFLDEQILRSQWPGRQQWLSQPLQLVYFNENTAGEGFFARLQALMDRPERAHVLEIYYLCLTLGFQGRYAARRGEGLPELIEAVRARLAEHVGAAPELSPRGLAPDGHAGEQPKARPAIPIGIGVLAVAALAVGLMKVALVSHVGEATRAIEGVVPPPKAAPSSGRP